MTDPIRARLDSRLFPHPLPPGCGELLAALRAVLDLCDDPLKVEGPQAPAIWVDARDVRAAIAAALGVEPAAADWMLKGGVPFGTTNGEPG